MAFLAFYICITNQHEMKHFCASSCLPEAVCRWNKIFQVHLFTDVPFNKHSQHSFQKRTLERCTELPFRISRWIGTQSHLKVFVSLKCHTQTEPPGNRHKNVQGDHGSSPWAASERIIEGRSLYVDPLHQGSVTVDNMIWLSLNILRWNSVEVTAVSCLAPISLNAIECFQYSPCLAQSPSQWETWEGVSIYSSY